MADQKNGKKEDKKEDKSAKKTEGSVADLWLNFFNEASKENAKASASVMKTALCNKGAAADANRMKEVALVELAKFEKQRMVMFEEIFAKYDKNGDAELDDKETEALVVECLKSQKEFLPTQVAQIVDMTVGVGLDMMRGMGLDNDEISKQEKEIRAEFGKTTPGLIKNAAAALDVMLKDTKALSSKMFKALDSNGDGKIQKSEFLSGYQHALSEVVNPEKIVHDLEKGLTLG